MIIIDPCKKGNFNEVVSKFKESYNGLTEKFTMRQKRCFRHQPDIYQHVTAERDLEKENKIKKLENLIDRVTEKLEKQEEMIKMMGIKKKSKARKRTPSTKIDKCGDKYDWSYVDYYANDYDVSPPNGMTLQSASSYYVLPGVSDKYYRKSVKTAGNEHDDDLSCDTDYIKLPRNRYEKWRKKHLSPDKKMKEQLEIAKLLNRLQEFKKKIKQPICIYKPRVEDMTLLEKIDKGFIPDLEDRADLISLFEKVTCKKKSKPKKKKYTLREEECIEVVEQPKLSHYKPPNDRQLEVLNKFTPDDHQQLGVIERRQRGLIKMDKINKLYYGNAPTLWQCKRIDDTWLTEGVRSSCDCHMQPCVCPKKPEDEIKIKKKKLAHATLLALTSQEKTILKDTWNSSGISKNTLAMKWFTKLYKEKTEDLIEQNPGIIVEELFMDKDNLDYMDKLADGFDLIVQNIHKPVACTKLIWETGLIHSSLVVKDGYFDLLKDTVYNTIKENLLKLTKEQLDIWKTFIGIMFDIAREAFLWNRWPNEQRIGIKRRKQMNELIISDTTICSGENFFVPSKEEIMDENKELIEEEEEKEN